jgi:hypothetical protein
MSSPLEVAGSLTHLPRKLLLDSLMLPTLLIGADQFESDLEGANQPLRMH